MNNHSRIRRPGTRRPDQAQRRSGTGDTLAGTALRLVRPTFALWLGLLFALLAAPARGETVFIEAETFQPSSDGWVATANDQTRRASRVKTLWGANGVGDAVATKTVQIAEAGQYRIWVRYMQVAAWRGPFQLAVAADDKHIAAYTFDLEILPDVADWEYTWQSFDADLPAGVVTLSLAKHKQKNCVAYVRHVDCLLLTTDNKLVPDHLPYGPQTLVRVTMGEGYDRPVYLHLFADHYRSPWYAHYAIGRDGIHQALAPPTGQMMQSGNVTPWCNLTPTVYQDSGAALNLSVRHTYHEKTTRFRAKLEFGRASREQTPSEEIEVIRTFDVEATPNGLVIIAPPDLESPENIALLKRDQEFAEEVGALADAFDWPKHGRRPVKIPFLASASISGYDLPVDAAVTERELQTLDYFGFNGAYDRIVHGAWHMKNDSYCQPDLDTMRDRVKQNVEHSGPNLTRTAAAKLRDWVASGGTLFLTAGAATRDEFNRPLDTLNALLPADCTDATTLEPFHNAGRFLNFLNTKDTVTWDGETLEVLSVKQALQSRPQADTLATFADGSPAVVSRVAEKGRVICCGFLPALSYIKPALVARRPLEEKLGAEAAKLKATENNDQPEATNATASTALKLTNTEGIAPEIRELLDRSHNPWQFSDAIRERILSPVRVAKLTASLTCDTSLVDAIELRCEQGILVALSNHTLKPLPGVQLTLRTNQPVVRVDSVRHGALQFEQSEPGVIRFAMPLEASDFVTASTTAAEPFAAKVPELKIGTQPVNRILFLGNSITLHGPAPQIGWTGNWGMAASSEDKDYVHVLLNQIIEATGGQPQVMIKYIADFERNLTDYNIQEDLKQELAFKPDVIIIPLGENTAAPTTDESKPHFASAFANQFAELNQHGQPTLFVRSQFWQDAVKDQLIKQACDDANGIFIDIGKLGTDPTNFARTERQIDHPRVASHSGDKGMRELANALWNAIQNQGMSGH